MGHRGHLLAQQNPLRWSQWNRLDVAIADLANFNTVQDKKRAVEIRTKREMVILKFDNVQKAISALRFRIEATMPGVDPKMLAELREMTLREVKKEARSVG